MKYVLLLTAAAGFQLAPMRMRAVHVLRAADYAEAIESERIVLRRATICTYLNADASELQK